MSSHVSINYQNQCQNMLRQTLIVRIFMFMSSFMIHLTVVFLTGAGTDLCFRFGFNYFVFSFWFHFFEVY